MDLLTALLEARPACSADADLFTGPDAFEPERFTVRRDREAKAKQICRACPALSQCLAYALAIDPYEGVWAGLSASEIHALSLRLTTGNEQHEQEVA